MRQVGLIVPRQTVESFPCPVCGKEYKTEKNLAEHIEKKHPDFSREEHSEEESPE